MAYSSILAAGRAPALPSGRDADALGPSDNTDSGSDAIGTIESHDDSDSSGTGARGAVDGRDVESGSDILPDRIVNLADGEGFPEADPDGMEMTDLDADDIAVEGGDAAEDDR